MAFAGQFAKLLMPSPFPGLVGRADVAASARSSDARVSPAGAAATREAPLAIDELNLSFVEIKDLTSRQVVTVVGMLSPSNKYAGGDREKYLQKRHQLARTEIWWRSTCCAVVRVYR